ncbi:hypothetical protein ES319_D04G223700v1 [Gossypium barbadense]|uniref:Uncharacterized protein n=1 Tax=Gossypium barbadense TaxID=3634 RepID=A0A5J5RZG3_GOSBA|nr:hypothetical protein ES319_D04G223700v1 [Gossypium barbadense]
MKKRAQIMKKIGPNYRKQKTKLKNRKPNTWSPLNCCLFHISLPAVQSIASLKKSSISCYLFSLQTFHENLFNLGASAIFPLVGVDCRL